MRSKKLKLLKIKTLDLEKEIKKLIDASKRFFGFIDKEIKIDNIY
jgi:hypothetical protein|nr:MAG TPA: hypothetical protein [Caudoviricetes sp.]